MAGNTKKGHRSGAVLNRSQSYNPKNKTWVKRDTETGKIMAVKKEPFKGVRKKTGKTTVKKSRKKTNKTSKSKKSS